MGRGLEFETFVVIVSSQVHYPKIPCKKYEAFPLEMTLASMWYLNEKFITKLILSAFLIVPLLD